MHKYPFKGSSVLQQEQRDDWMDGMPKLLTAIRMSTKRQEPCVRRAFHESILSYSTDLLKIELDAFLPHKDNRTQTGNIRNKAPSTPAFLRMVAADITPTFLDRNVLGECEKVFSGSHDDWEGVPLLWELVTKLVAHPNRHGMVVMALSILCYAKNDNMRRVQSMVGMMLHQAGLPQRVKAQLNQLGVSIGCTAINKAVHFQTRKEDACSMLVQTYTKSPTFGFTTISLYTGSRAPGTAFLGAIVYRISQFLTARV
ncbi:hypothetical protein Egran_00069 [Elaphomyces granulatus]|uniref:Uncharacterized protein n=1 Tax=Elaphomyces granulatus TaxID=519963 RepID=A0A232M6Y5_9EURO|nr:hypothetical protein Egran_00069 [Elaphomyces granulatus]